MKTKTLSLLFGCFALVTHAQILTGISSKWSDDFREWAIYTDIDDEDNALEMTFQSPKDYTDWGLEIRETSGLMKLKWKDDPSQWELRMDNKIVSATRIFKDDPTGWRISDGTTSIDFKTRNGNDWNEWIGEDERYGVFYVYTAIEGDPRDWIIKDLMVDPIVNLPLRTAMMFIAVINSIPK